MLVLRLLLLLCTTPGTTTKFSKPNIFFCEKRKQKMAEIQKLNESLWNVIASRRRYDNQEIKYDEYHSILRGFWNIARTGDIVKLRKDTTEHTVLWWDDETFIAICGGADRVTICGDSGYEIKSYNLCAIKEFVGRKPEIHGILEKIAA